ncbi:efflux RND transporter permease subunit [Sinimarinibacterium thermocellulolyticum]|uniref:Efflux RND transporter permease subunit n=1 Tax=Sinimarinibacterium thermocellulolyticum TaxID=3170016 RepID=A0ABV2ADC7_9GAMM
MTRSERAVARMADVLIGSRKMLAVIFTLVTLALGYSATKVQLDPGFLKLIPIEHPYMRTMMQYMDDFSGANKILVNLRWKGEGDIYNPAFMKALQETTDEVFFIPGINRTKVSSLFTPNVYYIEITEDGFRGEPVVPARYSGTAEDLERVRNNVEHSGQIGQLVATDLKGAMVQADLHEYDPDAGVKVDYWEVQAKLEEIRGRYESPVKYVYRMKTAREPFAAGEVVAEGYVDYGAMLGMQKFRVLRDVPGAEGKQEFIVDGSEVSVETVENPSYNPDIEVNIIGFARLLGDVIKGLVGVFAFFAIAFAITALLLYWYTRSLRTTVVALFVAMLPVLWLIGVLPLLGYGIDPMSILVPFLIFSIGVSHAVQMTNAWRMEVGNGATPVAAAHASFCKLFIPGAAGLLTEALGFGVIMLIDIPIVHELGITACVGVLLMIITNKMILPIILAHLRLEPAAMAHAGDDKIAQRPPLVRLVGNCAEPRFAVGVFAIALALLAGATWKSRELVIGDSGEGVPELHEDSRYNQDNRVIASTYDIGVDVLTVIAEAPGFEGDSCLHYPVVELIDRFELYMKGVEGVQSVISVAGIGKLVISAFNEGNPRWRALPRSQVGLSTGSKAFDPNLGLNNEGCKAIQVMIFMKDHEGDTIQHVVAEIKRFIEDNPVDGVTLRLASGNVGVMAATNEAVAAAEVKMLLAIFGSLILFCYLTFRSWIGVICVMTPLLLVTVFCNALMATLGIGLKVATLPVIALGVGVGVDYGLYLFERIQHHMADPRVSFREAFERSMVERGSAAVFTAITMSVGVATWMFSALKFQADMGVMLSFMFLVNMFGAICLLPALGAWFYRDREPAAALATPLR